MVILSVIINDYIINQRINQFLWNLYYVNAIRLNQPDIDHKPMMTKILVARQTNLGILVYLNWNVSAGIKDNYKRKLWYNRVSSV